MVALFVLTRSQLRIDPIQPSSRASPQISVGPDSDYRRFQNDPRPICPGGGIEDDHIRIKGTVRRWKKILAGSRKFRI